MDTNLVLDRDLAAGVASAERGIGMTREQEALVSVYNILNTLMDVAVQTQKISDLEQREATREGNLKLASSHVWRICKEFHENYDGGE